jgi:hypothetical protein
MAWIDLASNQMVSYTDAQTSGFALNSGQSQTTSNQCMTKSDITTKYNVTISGYSNNQLVPKSDWVGVGYAFYWQRYGGSTQAEACAAAQESYPFFANSTTLSVGMQVYSNAALTLPITYTQVYYHKLYNTDTIYETNTSGIITSISTCVVNSVVFSSSFSYTGSGSANYSGTVTITGASATFNARSTSTGNFTTDTNINIGGNARRARQTTTGTLNSTTFTLTPGTYSYTFSCQVTGGGTGIGQIIFTQ